MFPGCLLPQGHNEPNTAALTPDTEAHTQLHPRGAASAAGLVLARTVSFSASSHRVRSAVTAQGAAQSLHEGTSTTSVLTLILFAPRFPRGWAPQPPGTHPVPGMSLWLGRAWGGMRLCGNAASLARVATKQREVFRRLCNMYTVTPATARPQGISGAQLRLLSGSGPCGVRSGCATEHQLPACQARPRAQKRGESSILWLHPLFPHPANH